MRVTKDDVGEVFVRDGELYRLISYSDQPTATFEAIGVRGGEMTFQHHRVSGVVGAPIFDGFVKLVPEPEPG